MPTSANRLREMLYGSRIATLIEAHNTLSALVAQEAGFDAIWLSSLTMSCAYGVRDSNELTVEHILDNIEYITERVHIPVLLDADTGYGGFNQFRRLVRRLCVRKVGGVCIEDKVFPKTNSFINPTSQKLISIDEFCGKIRAGCDTRTDDLIIVARTEALVIGSGLDEALLRGRAYSDAGADALLVHSRASSFDEIAAFMKEWDRNIPIICVPTTYADTPINVIQEARISAVIWANHLLRASLLAMQQTACYILEQGNAHGLENQLVPLNELWRLQNVEELQSAEHRYVTSSKLETILLYLPSPPIVDFYTSPLTSSDVITRWNKQLKSFGESEICNINTSTRASLNDQHVLCLDKNSIVQIQSILARIASSTNAFVILTTATALEDYLINLIYSYHCEALILVNATQSPEKIPSSWCVHCTNSSGLGVVDTPKQLLKIGHEVSYECTHGMWTGIMSFRGHGIKALYEELTRLSSNTNQLIEINELINSLVRHVEINVVYVNGGWEFAQ
ncbi:MAG: phosphoenolpyruvate mutase [Tildeniella nuda ZEHNDER 1965/U140]|jgi:phosphoenolpyruvate phosphomutase|nr:phosphoenolpyruvate mutase [Tildeniella nuda ZEHNDER 1965/U140]